MTAHMKPQRTRNKFAREERERKAFEAGVRQELADKRKPREQLARLDDGGYNALKERVKLGLKIVRADPSQAIVIPVAIAEEPKTKKGNKNG
jgi:hypothetical protein